MTPLDFFRKMRDLLSRSAYWRDRYCQCVADAEQGCGPFVVLDGSVWISGIRVIDQERGYTGSAAGVHFRNGRID